MSMMQGGSEKPAAQSAPPANRLFGKFRLLANLGAGGSGEVFLALSRSSVGGVNKLVVIKRLRHYAEDDVRSQAQEMFLNEARLATLLNHPNIVQTNDVGVEDGHLFLTMEYLEGQPLNAIVKSAVQHGTKLDMWLGVRIVSEALAGLHYAHELKDYAGASLAIVHRDLSPHNLFVTYEGVTKVVDFGIAKTAGGAKTEEGVIKGKFAYMAPEQAADGDVDRRADIFAVGIVLWELLTGERLVYRRNDVQTIHRLLNDTFEAPSTVRAEIGPDLDAIVMKALAKDPSERYQTAQEMREALEKLLVARGRLVRHEEVGSFVTSMFDQERTAIRKRIQQCIASAQDDVSMDSLPALGRTLDGTTPNGGIGGRIDASGAHRRGAMLSAVGEESAPHSAVVASPQRGRATIAIAVGVAVVAVALVAAFSRRAPAPAPAPAAAPIPVETAAVAPAPTPPVAVAPAVTAPPEDPTAASASAAAAPAAAPARAHGGGRRGAPSHAAAPAAPAAPAPAPSPAPAPPPQPSSTAHGRVFNTSL
jgi:serine/threonine-protein kinase